MITLDYIFISILAGMIMWSLAARFFRWLGPSPNKHNTTKSSPTSRATWPSARAKFNAKAEPIYPVTE